jgi:hypothetical protein
VLYWAVTTTATHGFRLSTVGVILMVVGVLGLIVSTAVFATSRRTGGRRHSLDRQVTDTQGRTAEIHEQTR